MLVFAGLSWFLIEGMEAKRPRGVPEAVPVSLTAFAMILILLSSRLRSGAIRRALSSMPGLGVDLPRLIDGYYRGTLISYLVLAAAAALGLLVALFSGIAFYGIVLCAASAAALAMRWPRADDIERIAQGRRSV